MYQIGFGPDPTERAYSAPDPVAIFRGPTSKGTGEGRRGDGRGEERREEERRGEGKGREGTSFAIGRKKKKSRRLRR